MASDSLGIGVATSFLDIAIAASVSTTGLIILLGSVLSGVDSALSTIVPFCFKGTYGMGVG